MIGKFKVITDDTLGENMLTIAKKLLEVISAVNDMEAKTQPTTQAASSLPQMPPSCSRCLVVKPCELMYFSEECFNRLRRHFLLA
jgi:hypothetical protein